MLQETNTTTATQLDEVLKADHEALEERFEQVLCTMRAGDPDDVRAAWLALDTALHAHLTAEEQLMLPSLEQTLAHEAARVRREHGEIRRALEQLGIDLDLHMLRAERAERFITMLRSHARHEDEVLYAWSQQHLGEDQRRSVLAHLRAALAPSQRGTPSARPHGPTPAA